MNGLYRWFALLMVCREPWSLLAKASGQKIPPAQGTPPGVHIAFPAFKNSTFVLLGSATFRTDLGALVLTPTSANQTGRALYPSPVQVTTATAGGTCAASSWSTSFKFQIFIGSPTDPRAPEDQASAGLAFVMASNDTALGLAGGYLGYGGAPPGAFNTSLAVEFDVFQDHWDPNSNHVALLPGGDITHGPGGAVGIPKFALKSGVIFTTWIEYDAATSHLRVFLSDTNMKPVSEDLYVYLDMCSIFGANAAAFLSFTAATGPVGESHVIASWSFDSSLPSPPSPPPRWNPAPRPSQPRVPVLSQPPPPTAADAQPQHNWGFPTGRSSRVSTWFFVLTLSLCVYWAACD